MNENQRNKNAEQVRNRRLAITAAGAFLVAVGIFGGLSYLQRQVVTQSQTLGRPAFRDAPDITPQEKEISLARARVIREKFRPWALQHQAELTRMLRAKPNDQAAIAAVWDALPPNGAPPGLKVQELLPTGDPLSPSSFSWGPVVKGTNTSTVQNLKPEDREMVLMSVRKNAEQRQDDFASHRDIVISDSMGSGRTRVQMWASGRITERSRLPAKDRPALLRKLEKLGRPARESDLWGPYREIETPFDFLAPKP